MKYTRYARFPQAQNLETANAVCPRFLIPHSAFRIEKAARRFFAVRVGYSSVNTPQSAGLKVASLGSSFTRFVNWLAQ